MLNKKLLSLASLGALTVALSTAAFAGGQSPEPMAPSINTTGFTAGMSYATYGQTDFAALVGYVNDWFLVDLGAGYQYVGATAGGLQANRHVFGLRGDLGLRHYLEQSLFFTYGVLGDYGWYNNSAGTAQNNPYVVGAFIGLDYQPLSHWLFSGKISPVTYVSKYNNTSVANLTSTGWDVFSAGSLAISYVFN